MAKIATCESCGRYGSTELRFGINYCPECMRALRDKDSNYFDRIGLGKASQRAVEDITATVMSYKDAQERKKREEELKEKRNQAAVEKAGGYWEYKVVTLYDSDSGSIDAMRLEGTINDLGKEGWRLRCAFTNELGHNTNTAGVGGISSGTNATIDQNVLIFERFVNL